MLYLRATNHPRQSRQIHRPYHHAALSPRIPLRSTLQPASAAPFLHRLGVAIGASHRVRRWCARAFCATAGGGVIVVTPELRAQILRLYLAEHWRVGTIARQLRLHRDTVRRVLAISSVLRTPACEPPRLIDLYLPSLKRRWPSTRPWPLVGFTSWLKNVAMVAAVRISVI
jgi:hypothetical protein